MKRQHRGPGSPRAAAAAIPGQAPAALGPPSRGAGAPGQASPRPAGGGGLAGRYLGQPALVVRVLAAQHPLQLVHAARPGSSPPCSGTTSPSIQRAAAGYLRPAGRQGAGAAGGWSPREGARRGRARRLRASPWFLTCCYWETAKLLDAVLLHTQLPPFQKSLLLFPQLA